MSRPASKSTPTPRHRSSSRARERILAAADGWAYLDGEDSHETGIDVVERMFDVAFGPDLDTPYSAARAMLVALVDNAPPATLRAMAAEAKLELAALKGAQS
jgi:hypothetical protein